MLAGVRLDVPPRAGRLRCCHAVRRRGMTPSRGTHQVCDVASCAAVPTCDAVVYVYVSWTLDCAGCIASAAQGA